MIVELVSLIITLVLLRHLISRYTAPKHLPPGPRPFPLIGNLPQLIGSLKTLHVGLANLAKQYGSVFTIHLNGQRIIVVSTAAVAREALIERKDLIAGRPYTFSFDYGTRGCKDIAFNDFSPTLVLQRKIVHTAIRMYLPFIEGKVNHEVDALLTEIRTLNGAPFDPHHFVTLVTLNTICAVSFGTSYKFDDPEFAHQVEMNDEIGRSYGVMNILDVFPFLIHFPIEASRIMKKSKRDRDAFLFGELERHKADFDPAHIRDLTDGLIKALADAETEDSKLHNLITVDHVAMTMGDMLSAGVETTATTLRWMLAYLLRYPEVQASVHAELDDVIGRDKNRIITLEERARLPYLEATIAETLRIAATVPLTPHKALTDTTLDGYHIPKGTTVVFNIWAIHHDPLEWQDPEGFDSSRFLDSEGKFSAAGVRSYLPFGAGRRVCVGESLAKMELFLVASRLLHQFEFLRPEGAPLPQLNGGIGIVHFPMPYQICAKERL